MGDDFTGLTKYHRYSLLRLHFKSRFWGSRMRLISGFLALALSTSAALAGDVGPLAPGAPAGVKRAQDVGNNTILYVALGAAVIAGIAIAASSDDNAAPTPTPPATTTTTTTV